VRLHVGDCLQPLPAPMLRIAAVLPRLAELYADRANGLPREVLSRHSNDNCLPRLRSYFAELDLGTEPENKVR
jgi:hypothetical protein